MQKKLKILIIIFIAFNLLACGFNKPKDYKSNIAIRELLIEHDCILAIAYLGDFEHNKAKVDEKELKVFFNENNYDKEFPFLKDLADWQIVVNASGEQVFLIIPRLSDSSIAINNLQTGEVLYRSEDGSPIILLCNEDRLNYDTEVIVVENDEIIAYIPHLDTEGSLVTESEKIAFLVYENKGFILEKYKGNN